MPDDLLCLFTAEVDERRDSYVIEVPEREVDVGEIQPGQAYRVAILASATGAKTGQGTEPDTPRQRERGVPEPPVEEGEIREVEIEDVGEQGDGIARIDRGYIVFVSDTEVGDRVTVEITDVQENFAFGEVTEGPY